MTDIILDNLLSGYTGFTDTTDYSWINQDTESPQIDHVFTTDTDEEEYYENIRNRWETEFPSCPFSISLPSLYLNHLDDPFTNQPVIIILDNRIPTYFYHFWKICSKDFAKYNTGITIVKTYHNQPITLRRILNTMIKDNHYHKFMLDHHFLENFTQINNNMYHPWFGS